MCHTSLNPLAALGSGAVNGGHRQATQATYGNPPNTPDPGNTGAQTFVAQYNAAHAAQAAYANQAAFAGYAQTQSFPGQGSLAQAAGLISDPTKIEDAGITAGEIIAWRCWRTDAIGSMLYSTFIDKEWCPETPMEEATIEHHLVGTGVHAWKSERKAYQYGCSVGGFIAYGQIKLWGTVYEYEMGYRAQFGKVLKIKGIIGSCTSEADIVARLNKIYGESSDANS